MDITKIDDIKSKIHYEVGRTEPPEGFPKFHDIPKGRYTSQEFFDLEQKHVFSDSWVVAGREDQIPNVGDFFTFKKLEEPMLLIRGKDGVIRSF